MIAAIAGALESSLIELTSAVADDLRGTAAPASAALSSGALSSVAAPAVAVPSGSASFALAA